MRKSLLSIIVLLLYISVNSQDINTITLAQDTILKRELESIRIKDQALRLLLPEIEIKFGKDSEEMKYFWSLIHKQDSINEAEVIEIIKANGWLGANRVGNMANQSLWLVIQHAALETQEKYLPKLKESVEKGESDGWYLAFLEDRILMRKGEKQVYGSQTQYNTITGKYHIYQIRDVNSVNERRLEIGLEPIEEYATKNGYVFDQ